MSKKRQQDSSPRPAGGTLQDKLTALGLASSKPAPTAAPPSRKNIPPTGDKFGRAPYNFVPAPKDVQAKFDGPPSGDRYHLQYGNPPESCFSGEINLEIEAETDFYIRGMWSLPEFLSQERNTQSTRPFEVFGQLRLPGSSLRGMVRNLVEILGKAPLEPINDTQLFFRSIGASDQKQHDSYEPNAADYKRRMFNGSGKTESDPLGPMAKAGFLHPDQSGWWIRPAKENSQHRTSWYRPDALEQGKLKRPIRVYFLPEMPEARKGRGGLFSKFGIIKQGNWSPVRSFAEKFDEQKVKAGWIQGWLVSPGWMQGRRWNWIILPEDTFAAPITVPEPDRQSYLEAGVTQEIKDAKLDYSSDHGQGEEGIPCFYIKWNDSIGNHHVSFGHTPFFRLPYSRTPRDANPAKRPADAKWDLAQLLFGRVPDPKTKQEGARGRVFFEDALLVRAGAQTVADAVSESVLGQPKPTTYQHYLEQPHDDGKESLHWDSKGSFLRGHKMYWHRPGASTAAPPDAKANVKTTYQKALAHNIFTSRVRFENLNRLELGVLVTALQLPHGCRHRLGMGKPLGMGSFRISIQSFQLISREKRYSSFFANSPERLELQIGEESPGKGSLPLSECRKRFAEWYLGGCKLDDQAFEDDLWNDSRLKELRALLTWKDNQTPEEQAAWLNKTRYLSFGSVERFGSAVTFNEYKSVGDPRAGKPLPAPRRPLPRATLVLHDNSGLAPDSPSPQWLPESERNKLGRPPRKPPAAKQHGAGGKK